jgi:hypothetical protein
MVLEAKYDSIWGGWRSNDTSRSHGVGLWKYFIREWRVFFSHTRLDPGDGSKIRFWEDIWCGEVTLKDTFPGLYNIASAKEARRRLSRTTWIVRLILFRGTLTLYGWFLIGKYKS